MAEHYCQFILNDDPKYPPSVAVDFNNPDVVCCGKIARCIWMEEWVCVEHYEILTNYCDQIQEENLKTKGSHLSMAT